MNLRLEIVVDLVEPMCPSSLGVHAPQAAAANVFYATMRSAKSAFAMSLHMTAEESSVAR